MILHGENPGGFRLLAVLGDCVEETEVREVPSYMRGIVFGQHLCEAGHFIGGGVSADGYQFSSSVAVVDGNFVGLALDEVNESDRTPQRIDDWIATLRPLLD